MGTAWRPARDLEMRRTAAIRRKPFPYLGRRHAATAANARYVGCSRTRTDSTGKGEAHATTNDHHDGTGARSRDRVAVRPGWVERSARHERGRTDRGRQS